MQKSWQQLFQVLLQSPSAQAGVAGAIIAGFKDYVNLTNLLKNLQHICYIFVWKFASLTFILSHSTLLSCTCVLSFVMIKIMNFEIGRERKNHKICTQTYLFCKTLLSSLVPELNNDIICWYQFQSLFIPQQKCIVNLWSNVFEGIKWWF